MLVPILAMTLVDKLDAAASNLIVTATVPAPIPEGAPVITAPANGSTVQSQDVTVAGTCPVITPAVIITIYDGNSLAGSAMCSAEGRFLVPIVVSYGAHTLTARVVTITDGIGKTSTPVQVTYWSSSRESTFQNVIDDMGTPLRILTDDTFILIKPTGDASWTGSFTGGRSPYKIQINWGDGAIDMISVADSAEQKFTHRYKSVDLRDITITVHDARGDTVTMHIAGATQFVHTGVAGLDANGGQVPPVIAFIQKYMWQIYIGTLSALVFLWYLEHGRHIILAQTASKKRLRPRHH